VLLISFFVDVALKLWKASSAGRSHAGLRETGYCERTLKSNAAVFYLNCLKKATQF
jgi:hypothetical protein